MTFRFRQCTAHRRTKARCNYSGRTTNMGINQAFIKEVEQESVAARAMLERIPAETFDWKPHEKSMSMRRLAVLVADMFGWLEFMIDQEELDFAKGYTQPQPKTTQDRK